MKVLSVLESARKWIAKGYSVIPVTIMKNPATPSWRKFQRAPMPLEEVDSMFENAAGMAVLCGGFSRVFCLDIDAKYDLSGTIFEDLKAKIPKSILRKAMCQKTQNNGYHLVFKVPSTRLFGNEKFASRYTTAYEKHRTYLEAFRDVETRDNALKLASNDKVRVLLESRSGDAASCGGYFLVAPTPGYEILGGKIGELTEDEYDTVVEIARSFNEVVVPHKILKEEEYRTKWTVTPFDHFNKEGDALQLLLDNGWSIVANYGKDVRLRRPGKVMSKDSGIYDSDKKVFNCYTTSTCFETGKGYTASSVYILLEHDNDPVKAYKALIELGWGVK